MNRTHNIRDFGAVGDGMTDDSLAIQAAFAAAQMHQATVYAPSGRYRCTLPPRHHYAPLAIVGDSSGTSQLIFPNGAGLDFTCYQVGMHQPNGITLRDIALHAAGDCGRALRISYGQPEVSNEHFTPSVVLRDVRVVSDDTNAWAEGIEIEGAWNPRLENVFVSGSPMGMDWNAMRGSGVNLKGMCVNAHLSNVTCNFWAEGLRVHADGGRNTEGLFASNCHMVGVKRGVWIKGNPDYILNGKPCPRIHTFNWTGGMIENRVGGVTGGSAAFHLEHVWSASITGCQMITETKDCPEFTYGVIAQDCRQVHLHASDVNAYTHGFVTTGDCRGITVVGNSFANTDEPVLFSDGTRFSQARHNVKDDQILMDVVKY